MEDKGIKEEDIVNSDSDNTIDNVNNKSKKKVIYIIFGIIVFILICLIAFCTYYNSLTFRSNSNKGNNDNTEGTNINVDRDKDDQNEQDKNDEQEVVNNNDTSVKNEQDESVDLAKCTFKFTMSEYNAFTKKDRYGLDCSSKYKYIITDANVAGNNIDVQIIDGAVDIISEAESGLYVNGVKIASLYSGYSLDANEVSVHDNMLFAHIDGGTYILGTTEIFAFDKNGKVVYKLSEHTSSLNGGINRATVKINDNSITFSTVASDGFSKGNSYVINFSNGVFSEPTITG